MWQNWKTQNVTKRKTQILQNSKNEKKQKNLNVTKLKKIKL